jgi:hypothetical protein
MTEGSVVMKPICCVCVLLFLASVFVRSNPAPLISQPAAIASRGARSDPDLKTQAAIRESYSRLPLSFEANHGQTDSRVKFLSRGSGYTLFLTEDEAVFSLHGSEARDNTSPVGDQLHRNAVAPTETAVLRVKFVEANLAAKVTGTDQQPGNSNYFIGNDPKKWRSNVPTYARVKYEGIYPGTDLVYYGNQSQVEYDFVVRPGADPHRIQFDVRGANRINIGTDGDLVLDVGERELRCHKPVVYQEDGGTRREIVAHYVIKHNNRIGFEIADYDLRRPLLIDPLVYSTFLGGSGDEGGGGIAVDSAGNAYVTGTTSSTDFPTMSPLQPSYGGGIDDVFVTKINPSGSALVYSTYLGGSGFEAAYRIAVDSAGNAYVVGQTFSTNFPTMNALQPSYGGGPDDAFVTKIDPSGSALVYSTYLGGSDFDAGYGIAVDGAGNAYVTGQTASTNFPTMNPLQPTYGGGSADAFVTKINPSGSAFVYSTYLGGSYDDEGWGIVVDSWGNAHIAGVTASTDFPTMNPLQPTYAGGPDAFVAELNPAGSALVYSTYLGGSGFEYAFGVALDSSGNTYVVGQTASTDFPTTNPLQPTYGGGAADAFVAELNPAGSAWVYSTYLGGSGLDQGSAIAVDSAGDAYVTGYTESTNFPTMNPLQPTFGGGVEDGFVAELRPEGLALVYSTYLGGKGYDGGGDIAVDSAGNAYVTGFTTSTNFPTRKPLQRSLNGSSDAFVTKICGCESHIDRGDHRNRRPRCHCEKVE